MLTRQTRPVVAVFLLTSIFLLIYRSASSSFDFDLSGLQVPTGWSNGHYDLESPSGPVEIIDNESTVVTEGDDPLERPAVDGVETEAEEMRKATSAEFSSDAEKPDDLLSDKMLDGAVKAEEQRPKTKGKDATAATDDTKQKDTTASEKSQTKPESKGETGDAEAAGAKKMNAQDEAAARAGNPSVA